jgi:peptidyl-prolyl cis-trans isomerase D
MATIGKIRKHSTLLLIIIGGALVLFVLSDFLGSKGGSGRPKQHELAIVDGEKITAIDWENRLNEQFEMYKMQYGENINSAMSFQIREEVFNEMIRQTILTLQYEKVGLRVSEAEMYDMMTGVNIHPYIMQNFTDPQTGQFNPANVINYLQNLETMEPAQQQQWYSLEKIMKEERFFEKYTTLIKKSYFVPKAMAVSMYEKQGTMAEAKIIQLKYSSIPDDKVTLTDQDYEDYYNKHKNEYDQEESRWIDYVIFEILPSEKDLEEGIIVVNQFFDEFAAISAEDMGENFMFAGLKSDLDFDADTNFLKRTDLPAQADSVFNLPIGSMVGPYSENNSYFIMKLLAREERADSMEASHILIAYTGAFRADPAITATKEQAQAKADSLLTVVKGKDSTFFAQTAMQFSTDQSAVQNGGYLGWFADGMMVPEFNNACVNARNGDYFVVETPFGFHVVHLTGKMAIQPKVKVAMLKYTIEASSETRQKIFTEASIFAGENLTVEAFDKAVEDSAYVLRTSEYSRTSDFSLPGIEEGREIIRWSFGEEIVDGTVSQVYELTAENKNVVAIVRQVRHKGIAPLTQIKELIKPFVIKEKKADMLYEQMNKAKAGASSIEQIAGKLNIPVDTIDMISFASPNVPLIGPEPKVVGTVFGTEPGKISRTIRGEAAIFVVQVTQVTPPPATEDYSMVLFNQLGFFQNRVNYDVFNALMKIAEVEDNKILFY